MEHISQLAFTRELQGRYVDRTPCLILLQSRLFFGNHHLGDVVFEIVLNLRFNAALNLRNVVFVVVLLLLLLFYHWLVDVVHVLSQAYSLELVVSR